MTENLIEPLDELNAKEEMLDYIQTLQRNFRTFQKRLRHKSNKISIQNNRLNKNKQQIKIKDKAIEIIFQQFQHNF